MLRLRYKLPARKVLLAILVIIGFVCTCYYLRGSAVQPDDPQSRNQPAPVLDAPFEDNKKTTLVESEVHSIKDESKTVQQDGPTGRNAGCLTKERHITLFKPLPPYNSYDHSDLVHYVKLSYSEGGAITFNFREYLAVLSAYKFYKPEKILIHTNGVLQGKYWDKLQQLDRSHTSIEPNKVTRPTRIGGKGVMWIQHSADYVKVTKVKEFGGIVSDMDVIIINGTRLRELQRMSECVLSHEGTANIINAGFFSCVKGSPFITKWVDLYDTDYRANLWVHNAAFAPSYALLDKSSCYNVVSDGTVCQDPKWGNAQWWLTPGKVDWKSKIASHYWFNKILTYTHVPSDETVLTKNIGLAEMFNYVVNA